MNKLQTIEAFKQVVETGSFVAAAERMGVSPAMMTKYIRQLEAHLGARLLTRSTRSVQLTEPGENYYRGIVPLLNQLGALDDQVNASSKEPRGELRITAPALLGEHLLVDTIAEYQNQFEHVKVSVDITARQVDLFKEPYDLALRAGPLNNPDLVVRKLTTMPLTLCASPEYLESAPVLSHPRDLIHHHCLLNPALSNTSLWRFMDGKKPVTLTVNSRLKINSVQALKHAALKHQGLLYLPKIEVDSLLAAGKLVELLESFILPDLDIYIVYVDRRHLPAKTRCFIDLLTLGHL